MLLGWVNSFGRDRWAKGGASGIEIEGCKTQRETPSLRSARSDDLGLRTCSCAVGPQLAYSTVKKQVKLCSSSRKNKNELPRLLAMKDC